MKLFIPLFGFEGERPYREAKRWVVIAETPREALEKAQKFFDDVQPHIRVHLVPDSREWVGPVVDVRQIFPDENGIVLF